uniref:Long-chain-fatty-acid--CoA ligase n=1 Tax=Oryza rufipogon TaxID=4529 RepID=A0A0E0PTS6_ORYRU
MMKHLVESEKAAENAGPTYRNVLAKDAGLLRPPPGVESCWDVFRNSVEKYPDSPMLGRRRVVDDGKAGEYVWMTYKEVYDVVMKLAASISKSGISKGESCGIYGANCPEWIISMEACNALGVSCVPLYDSLGAGAVEFIVCHAEIQIAFVEERKIAELLKTCHATSKYLKTIISFGGVTNDQKEEAKNHGMSIFSWEEFLIMGGDHHFDLPEKKKSDICTIMYTSGTTGDPKGVMISNESLLVNITGADCVTRSIGEPFDHDDVYISYLPLAHIFDRIFEELFISHGSKIGFWRGDVKLLVDDIAALKPTVFCAVPRVLDRIYSGLTGKISSGGILKKALFNIAYKLKLDSMRKGIKHEKAAPFFDKLVFSKVKERLGGKLRFIVSGGAPLSVAVEEFLRVVTCASVVQGYGLTETGAASFVAIPNDFSMVGTVGPPVEHLDARLESVPEMGYDALSSIPRGEVCVKGSVLFSGYYKREDLTQEVMIDGWFHTGDVGEWQPNGSLKIIDRKKNIFKLSQGEYVAVENLENVYGVLQEIDSIWIYGNSFESFLVAVINPNQQVLEHWAEQNGISGSLSELCENSRAKEYILSELTKIAKEKKLKGYEFIRAVHFDPLPFDMERDLITPTYKKKRPQLLKHYQGTIDALYKMAK